MWLFVPKADTVQCWLSVENKQVWSLVWEILVLCVCLGGRSGSRGAWSVFGARGGIYHPLWRLLRSSGHPYKGTYVHLYPIFTLYYITLLLCDFTLLLRFYSTLHCCQFTFLYLTLLLDFMLLYVNVTFLLLYITLLCNSNFYVALHCFTLCCIVLWYFVTNLYCFTLLYITLLLKLALLYITTLW